VSTEKQSPFAIFQSSLGKNIVLAGAAGAIVAIMAGIWLWVQQPDYKVLFSNFDDRDGGAIIASLQQMNIPYKYAEGGGAILVPATSVHDVRLRLAAQGLPKGGNVGFELMENQKLGVSQFHEQVNYQRALEGELASSIQAINSVRAARVHLALPKSSVFVREQQKPTASVLLNLYQGRTLDPDQVTAIVHLVSSSVPDMPPTNVAVIDQNGNLLSDGKKAGSTSMDASQLKYVEDLQRSIVARIESIITPIMGEKNVRAEATVDVDFSKTEQAAETYGPNQPPHDSAVRSQQTNETSNTAAAGANGVPGSLSNQPPGSASAPVNTTPPLPGQTSQSGPASSGTSKKDVTTNYEVDKTVKYVQQGMGGIKRISVAVVVNYKTEKDKAGKTISRALTDQEKLQITDLAREAMGFDKDRGDSLNVVNSPFAGTEKETIPEETLVEKAQKYAVSNPVVIAKYVIGGILLLYMFFGVLRPMLKRLTSKSSASSTSEEAPSAAEQAAQTPSEPPMTAGNARTYEQKLGVAKKLASEDPKMVANVVKGWVNDE
jgi:flagellar M-ring protein FliF